LYVSILVLDIEKPHIFSIMLSSLLGLEVKPAVLWMWWHAVG